MIAIVIDKCCDIVHIINFTDNYLCIITNKTVN